ncbi:manganese efflux pump MntP family protein [Victivallis sp. Marseille-Q1083]|uniref:manganese efflux pump MntP n=1 Tax=Victivallis sp. Marseille-Q1083 TaxID=2717288 RepID=UPI00158D0D4B|nr:manganese efflux pump MntP family protein [Victivallis sp. Marseille-Q1083]
MSWLDILLVSFGVSIDALAVSICGGLSNRTTPWRHGLTAGAFFGSFQILMPLFGYFIASLVKGPLERCDHWIAFGLLALVGGKMIYEALKHGNEEGDCSNIFTWRIMLILAVATSLDALAVGASYAMLNTSIWQPALAMGVVTFGMSLFGVQLGVRSGRFFSKKIEIAGGVVIILIGVKILIEHLSGLA